MSYASLWKPAPAFYPMPNTGTVLDISSGSWVKGHKGQMILNGGFALFWSIAALPNMGKSTIAAGCCGAVLRAFPDAALHVHDTETTMVAERVERLTRLGMGAPSKYNRVPECLMSEGRMFFTNSVDYDGTQWFELVKKFAKQRFKEEKRVELEILNPHDGKPYEYFNPVIEFCDSFSGLKAENAVAMLAENEVGTKDLNMLAMRVNSGKSQIVDQINDLAARHAIYFLGTAHVGASYQLDPRSPTIKTLKWLKGDIKLKRVPENFSFQTGNCYIITHFSPMLNGSGKDAMPEYPYEPGDEDKQTDLIEIKVTNQRGKFGISGVPIPLVISQKDGFLPYMSNFVFLKEEGAKFGFEGNDRNYTLSLCPDIKLQRTNVRQKFRENPRLQHAAYILVTLYWMFTYWTEFDDELRCTPAQLYEEIKAMGYDWDALLDSRYWFMPIEAGKDIPFTSAMDLLRIRAGRYHPYWYPKSRKEMGLPEPVDIAVVAECVVPKESTGK